MKRCAFRSNRKGEFGFVWFFAIIAGIVILLLAIYGATRVSTTQRYETDSEIGKKISALTDPLEAGFTSATFGTISFQQDTRIRNQCSDAGFGESIIAASSKSEVGREWQDFAASTKSSEKHIFGMDRNVGKTYYVLSKAFNFPYKIADYVILISDEKQYCFKDTPSIIRDELESLKIPAIIFDNCSRRDDVIMVCFGSDTCDVSIMGTCEDGCRDVYETGVVNTQDGRTVKYVGDLVYPAIFSTQYIYECNVHRLLYRGSVQALILSRKSALMNARDCNTNLEPVLLGWYNALMNASIDDMVGLYPDAVELEESSKWEVCGVW